MTARGDDEAGAIQVVEAILVAVLVAGALIFFSLAQRPSFPADGGGRDQARAAADALAVLQGEHPARITDPGRDRLTTIVRALFGNPTDAIRATHRATINETLPAGTMWSLRLYNGFGRVEILASSLAIVQPREAAGASAYVDSGIAGSTSSAITFVTPLEAGPRAVTSTCTLSYAGSQNRPGGDGTWADSWRAWQSARGIPNSTIIPDFAPLGDWTFGTCGSETITVTSRTGGPASLLLPYTVELVVWDAY